MSDVTDRLDVIEATLAANQIPASMAALMRKLEQGWQPDAAVLLQPGSITPELLAPAIDTGRRLVIRSGTQTLTWGGASVFSDFPAVTHGVGGTPDHVWVSANGGLTGSKRVIVTAYGYTATQFTVDGLTDDRSTPAAATTLDVRWTAVRYYT
jgi:hypothetical protein